MTDKKITDLTNIVAADLVDADEFVVVDISADETMAITLGELKTAVGDGAGDLLAANNLSDLANAATSRTNLGLGTTDSPTFDGLTVEGTDGEIVRISSTVDGGTQQEFGLGFATNPAHTHPAAQILAKEFDASDSRAGLNFYTRPNNSDTASLKRLNINTDGDVSFYEDTGTTAKFFWDSSTERLGIGTSSPDTNLDVLGGIRSTSSGGYNQITTTSIGDAAFDSNGNTWLTVKNGAPAGAMRIDSSGNVGIGTTSPTSLLDVVSSGTTAETIAEFGNASVNDGLSIETNGNLEWGFGTKNTRSMTFSTNQTERMRINGSGNVGIGKTNPATPLDVTGTVTATAFAGDGSALTGIAAGGGATGGGSDQVFYENGQNVTTNYTITNAKNAMSAGPITVDSGVTVTVGAGETWTVV